MRRMFTGHRRLQISAGVVIALAALLYGMYRVDLLPVTSSAVESKTFVVAYGEGAPAIATALQNQHLIRSRNAFLTYINLHGLRGSLKAGSYALYASSSSSRIARILTSGAVTNDRLVVPEGYQIVQIEKQAAAKGITKAQFDAALKAPHTQAFLAAKPVDVDLEGYLFPDSYQVDSATTATALVDAMLNNFGTKVGAEYVAAFAAQGLTLHQGLTVASIVEREVSNANDRPIVAQVFLKRYRTKQPLGSDVTTQYAADLAGVAFNLDLNSPYNTRKVVGLPPGPICNPGLSSLDAVAHPATTDYSFFLAGSDGKTYFAHTYAEHQANIAKYLK